MAASDFSVYLTDMAEEIKTTKKMDENEKNLGISVHFATKRDTTAVIWNVKLCNLLNGRNHFRKTAAFTLKVT
jgi:hypothetical protein